MKNESLSIISWITAASVRFRDIGMKSIRDGRELISVVEGYPLAIRYRSVASTKTDAAQLHGGAD